MIKSMISRVQSDKWESEVSMADKGKKVTLQMIAAQAGVSVSTVSNVLAGKKGVGNDVRKQIIFLADTMGYQRNSMKSGRSCTIGILIPEEAIREEHSFVMNIYKWIVQKAGEEGVMTVLEAVREGSGCCTDPADLFSDMSVQGILIVGEVSEAFVQEVTKNCTVPVVCVDFYYVDQELDFIITDSYRGAYEITRLLAENGHKRIAYVGTPSAGSKADCYMGYQKAVFLYELETILPVPDEDGQGKSESLKLPENLPTAFVCSSERAARLLLAALRKRGLCVPEDVSLAVFGSFQDDYANGLTLTVYENDDRAMAEISVDTLLERMEKADRPYRIQTVEGKLHRGNSIAKREE